MSNVSSEVDPHLPPPKKWGIAAILLGLISFIGAQIAVGTVAYSIVGEKLSTSEQFLVYGGATLITLACLTQILRRYKANFRDLGLGKFELKFWAYAVAAFVAYIIISGLFTGIIGQAFPGIDLNQQQDLGFTDAAAPWQLVMVFVSLVILPPIVEELLFRGLIFRGFLKYFTPVVAALVTSVLFGVAHGQFNVGIDTFALSLVLCFLTYKTGSLWPSIVVHAAKNCIAFIFVFVI